MIHRQSSNDRNLAGTNSGKSVLAPAHAACNASENVLDNQKEPEHFSPLVADMWADLIMYHLRACSAAGELDLDCPVDILDFVPGIGQSGWLMVQALLRRAAEVENLHIRYIPVAPQRIWFSSLRKMPEFAPLLEHEIVVPMLWDIQRGDPCLLLPSGRKPWQPANPCVILLHDKWASLPQRLFAIHYGKLLEANLAFLKNILEPEQRSQQWKNVDSESLSTSFGSLLNHYLTHFNSSPIPYPEIVLGEIGRITSKLPEKYLLLSAAAGFASERSLRLCSFVKLIDIYEKEQRFSVNFHFLSHHFHQLGLETQEIEMQKGTVLQMAIHVHTQGENRLSSIAHKIDAGMFHHASALNEAMCSLGGSAALDSRLALLKISQYDPDIFMSSHAALIKSFTKSPNFDRQSWREALERVWANYLPTPTANKLHASLAPVAMHCGHWKLARTVILRGIQAFGKTTVDLSNLAWCEARTGQIKNARKLIVEALCKEPDNVFALHVKQRIEERLSSWDGHWRIDLHHKELPIVLEPLDLSHAEAYFYQYRDPQIAVMTGLPVLNTIEEVRTWITQQEAEPERVNYSIMHADYGFVGYINLAVSAHASYFCFWTGVDFQGNGIATAAARIACKYASELGVNVMLTSAYSDNARSIRALKRIGFGEIDIRALPPDQDRIFYSMISSDVTDVNSATELVEYYIREKLPLHFSENTKNRVLSVDA